MSRSSPESVTVPIEPTREMWAAMANAVIGKTSVHHDVVVEAVYRAMVTSAPAAGHAQRPSDEDDETIARRLATIMHGDDIEWRGFLTKAHHWMALSLSSTDREGK